MGQNHRREGIEVVTFILAHLSDIHLGPLAGFWPRHWNTKRLLGFINWQRRRRFVHRPDIVMRLVEDLRAQTADHIAVSGDLTNIGMPSEHVLALAWLEQLGAPDKVSVVPGNHDVYSPLRRDPGVLRWRAYMSSNPTGAVAEPAPSAPVATDDSLGSLFPYVRLFGRIALIGVNSAIPTAPGMAIGNVDEAQLDRLETILMQLARDGFVRVVMVHHPPLAGQTSPRRAMTNAAEFEALLCRAGAELVIHGHNHRRMIDWRQGPAAPFPVVGVPSASVARAGRHEQRASYNLYAFTDRDGGPAIEMVTRGLADDEGPVVELDRVMLAPPASMDKQT